MNAGMMNLNNLTDLTNICNSTVCPPVCDYAAMNHRYAHAYHLKKYAEIDADSFLNCTIEHGLNIVHKAVCANEVSCNCRRILTFSAYRKNLIETYTDLEAIPIGPYIMYTDSIYDAEQTISVKKTLGRTLLVFPAHSAELEPQSFGLSKFVDSIKSVSKGFDSVLICLYYLDINEKIVDWYKNHGFYVVTAGSNTDINFLPRQRAIIELSDAVMANDFTTGLAYSLSLNKPVYLMKQEILTGGANRVNTQLLECEHKYIDELFELASDPLFGNLENQKEWGKYMFGLDCIKTKNEMKKLLQPMMR